MAGNRRPRRRPALTEDGRENQLVSAAMDLAERQIAEGTASSQVITHYLKLGSTRERLEQERIKRENKLLEAKINSFESANEIMALYEKALDAMKSYAGQEVTPSYDNDEDVYGS